MEINRNIPYGEVNTDSSEILPLYLTRRVDILNLI